MACTAPKQLEEYRIHDNPPGISGWLCEGRFIYDAFVLNNKAKAIYYHGSQAVLKILNVMTAPGSTATKSQVIFEPGQHDTLGVKWYGKSAATAAALPTVTYGTAITTSAWTEITANGAEFTATAGDKFIRVIEVDSANKPIAMGDSVLNLG